MDSQTIRRNFLQFFKDNDHTLVPSSSVVPHDDPSILFINAGMNQFKDVFLGKAQRDYQKAASSQKCIRVGGKHNDLDNVGHTTRHLTLFEMLGNFSFGDYFKEKAIEYAWKVSNEVYGLETDKIWVSVFEDDDEAYELWKKWVPSARIVRMGEKDNFWAMGETGPCGPCSELLFDRGDAYGPGKTPHEDPSGERYFEFWNLVFMQFNRDEKGNFHDLPRKSIDTGSGLERIAALKMGVDNVFAIDLFQSLIAQIENTLGIPYDAKDSARAPAFHVIADHIRSLSFAIADGAQPGNIERGYVLRKILRRAVRYGKQLGVESPFLAKILPRLVSDMGDDYPELVSSKDKIAEILTAEEEGFFKTLKRGGNILSHVVEKALESPLKQINGEDAFKLKDTYGFPLEEVLLIAKDTGLEVNLESYQILEEKAKELSRAAATSTAETASKNLYEDFIEHHGTCEFRGYEKIELDETIIGLFHEGQAVESLSEGQKGTFLLKQTPFYAEKGGQVGDTGCIYHHKAKFTVKDCKSPYPGVITHEGIVTKGTFILGEPVTAQVDAQRREKIASNHTATHLLHYGLEKILGSHIRQAGSLVEPTRLRFDFNHHKSPTKQELRAVEHLVNDMIRSNHPVTSYELSYEEAQSRKEIKQFFGDKYGSSVRVVDIESSKELCGGTHVSHVGSIGLFRIVKEGSIASGVRRIEAVTGFEAEMHIYEQEEILDRCAELLKVNTELLEEKLKGALALQKAQSDQLKALKRLETARRASEIEKASENLSGTLFMQAELTCSIEEMQELADRLAQKGLPFVIALGTKLQTDRCQLLVKVSKDLISQGIKAGDLIKTMAPFVQGKGGGKPEMAQAGGKYPEGIHEALQSARDALVSS